MPESLSAQERYSLARELLRADDLSRHDEGIALLEGLAAEAGAPDQALADLGVAWFGRYERTFALPSLDRAEQCFREVLHRQESAARLSHLGMCLVRRAERFRDAAFLDEAVPLLRRSVAAEPARFAGQANLGLALQRRIEYRRDLTSLDEALAVHRTALDLAGDDPSRRARVLANLAATHQEALEETGDRGHVDAAVEYYRAAAEIVPQDDPALPGCYAGLARVLADRSIATGDHPALLQALRLVGTALSRTPEDDPDRPLYLGQQASAFRALFARTGDTRALDAAIISWREALRLTPGDHADRLAHQAHLATALRNRFEFAGGGSEAGRGSGAGAAGRGGDVGALDESVELLRDVVRETAPGDPELIDHRARLANSLHRGGVAAGDPERLREAAELLRTAAEASAGSPPRHTLHQANLGAVLLALASLTGDDEELEEARVVLAGVLDRAGPDDPALAEALLNLAAVYEMAGEPAGAAEDAYRRLIGSAPASALSRAVAAQHLGRLLARNDDPEGALAAFGTAVDLLDLVAWVGLGRDDQERLLVQFGGLASEAAACALTLGREDAAVEILEQGRGVLYAQALSLRSGADAARARAPELSERLTAVQALLEPAAEQEPGRVVWSRQEAAVERDHLIAEIRAADESFLRPPGLAGLRDVVGERPVAIINVSEHRCDAILLADGRTRVVPLPGLRLDDLRAHARSVLARPETALPTILPWLWDTTVGPVLEALGPAADGGRPHLWWLPTGPMSFLPLHAAGHRAGRNDTSRSALHRVVSSYTPTLRALAAGETGSGGPDVVVAIPETAGGRELPRAEEEGSTVGELLGPDTIVVAGDQATRARVGELLFEADVVHFACHAATDHERPSDSHLVLFDGRLRVRDLVAGRTRNADRERIGARSLAYLSACSTATAGARLPDENIHLAAALRLAGFTSVVATLWPVPDMVAARAATGTIGALADRGPAQAVHDCAADLYHRYPDRPAMWAGFVHVGPGPQLVAGSPGTVKSGAHGSSGPIG